MGTRGVVVILMRTLLCLLIVAPAWANTSIVSIDPTQMQAKITVHTDQPGYCTYRASRGTAFSSNLADLTDNTNTDARAGSIVTGRRARIRPGDSNRK